MPESRFDAECDTDPGAENKKGWTCFGKQATLFD